MVRSFPFSGLIKAELDRDANSSARTKLLNNPRVLSNRIVVGFSYLS